MYVISTNSGGKTKKHGVGGEVKGSMHGDEMLFLAQLYTDKELLGQSGGFLWWNNRGGGNKREEKQRRRRTK